MAFCMKCGKEIDDDAAFCRFCGASAVLETVVGDTDVAEETQPIGESKVKDSAKSGKTKRKVLIGVSACLAAAAVVCGVVIGYLKLNTPDKRIMQALDNTISADCFRIDLKTENMASKEYTTSVNHALIDNVDDEYYNDISVEVIRNNGDEGEALIYYSIANYEENLIASDGKYYIGYSYELNPDGSYNYDSEVTSVNYMYRSSDKHININKAVEKGDIKDFTDETKVSSWLENNLDMDIDDCKELLPQILKDISTSGSTPDYVTKYEYDSKDKSYAFTLDLEKFVDALDSDYDVRVSDKLSKKMSSSVNELVMKITLTNDNKYLSSVYLEYYNGKKTRSISAKFDKINDTEAFDKRGELKEEVLTNYISGCILGQRSNPLTAVVSRGLLFDTDHEKIVNVQDAIFTVSVPTTKPEKEDYEYETEYGLEETLYNLHELGFIPYGRVTFEPRFYNSDTKEYEYLDDDIKSYIEINDSIGAVTMVAVSWSD